MGQLQSVPCNKSHSSKLSTEIPEVHDYGFAGPDLDFCGGKALTRMCGVCEHIATANLGLFLLYT